MRTSENAQQIAREVVAARFGDVEVAYCAGSIVRGECTEYSDIDLVVVLPALKAAWRESFLHESWPVEAFVHDSSTLRYFFEDIDARSGIPSLPQMVDEGIAVCGDPLVARKYKEIARRILLKGPPPLSPESIGNAIYRITDLVDDLRAPRSKTEAVGTAVRLYEQLGDFALRSKGLWSGAGKQITRALRKQDPSLHEDFVSAFDRFFAGNDPTGIIVLAESVVAPHGGFLFDGYKRKAPAEWRKA